MVGDWTKGGLYDRVTVYRYGYLDGAYRKFHLCVYTKGGYYIAEPEREFDITSFIGSVETLCMVYPFVVAEEFRWMLSAWVNDSRRLSSGWASIVYDGTHSTVKVYGR